MSGGVEVCSTHSFCCVLQVVTALCYHVGKGEALATAAHSPLPHSLSGHSFSHHTMQGLSPTSSSGSPVLCSTDSASRNGCGFTWQEPPWPPALSGGKEAPLQGSQTSTFVLSQAPARWVTVQNINKGHRRRQKTSEDVKIKFLALL